MHQILWKKAKERFTGRRGLVSCLVIVPVAILAAGTVGGVFRNKAVSQTPEAKSAAEPPHVELIHPAKRTIVRVVGQPSFVEAFERTSMYPKVTGYIKKWNVDIGDKVKKGDVLCTLFVPELDEDWETKKATVKLDEERVDLALKVVKVAEADVQAAEARLQEAKAILDKFQSQADRWESEVKRLKREVQRGVVDPQILLESENQFRSSIAARDAAKATILKAEAELLSRKADLAKANVAVAVARADLKVAISDAKRLEAWVGYLTISAPYDGIITARNANTWDFVNPSIGDPSSDKRTPHLSPSGQSAPIYVVDRTDVVRIFVDIPEHDANYVKVGTKARVQIKGYRDQWIEGDVTRTSWALNFKSRTMRAEIDLPNPGSRILPGMYAYGKVIIERPDVLALPVNSLVHIGDQTYFYRYENGHAVRTEVQTGISDGDWVEVTNRQLPSASPGQEPWAPIRGSEKVIQCADLPGLADGTPVVLGSSESDANVARVNPAGKPE